MELINKRDNLRDNFHCLKSVQIRSYFCSVFPCIQTEYGDLEIYFSRSVCSTYSLREAIIIGLPKVKTFWGSLDATNVITLVFFVIWLFTLRHSEKVRKRKRKKKTYIAENFYESMISLTNKRSKLLSKTLDNNSFFFFWDFNLKVFVYFNHNDWVRGVRFRISSGTNFLAFGLNTERYPVSL